MTRCVQGALLSVRRLDRTWHGGQQRQLKGFRRSLNYLLKGQVFLRSNVEHYKMQSGDELNKSMVCHVDTWSRHWRAHHLDESCLRTMELLATCQHE